MDGVTLRFTHDALRAVARQALARKSGARGLRAILEATMLDLMYELPSRRTIHEVVVNQEVIEHRERPLLIYQEQSRRAHRAR